jgi:hypothetical protein
LKSAVIHGPTFDQGNGDDSKATQDDRLSRGWTRRYRPGAYAACGYATIRPDYAKAVAGYVIAPEPHACLTEWERRGKVRDNGNAVWYARIITYMAGAEAEKELLGSTVIGDGDDRDQIALMAEKLPGGADWGKLEPRLRAMARMLVRRHQERIELVARALLAKTTLSAKALTF